ncbi:MAG: NAD(P)/FAD-dependent oxidoreductase [Saprospiraceae bacterium]
MEKQRFDFAVVGGGIFGCYAALFLAGKGARIALFEKEDRLFQKASVVNQARLHGGYHYPRSMATALLSDEHKSRFTSEHRDFVNNSFEKYYAIDRYGSFTDGAQFERFCERLGITCRRVEEHPLFNFERIEALYLTEEHSFDPVLLQRYYQARVSACPSISLFLGTRPVFVEVEGDAWRIRYAQGERQGELYAGAAVNATYAAINGVNQIFGVERLALMHEISEIAFVSSPQMSGKGLTVMDGPFGSIMPFGRSGLLSLSSVAYTHHKVSYNETPHFDCMQPDRDPACRPEVPGICNQCARKPESNAFKMLAQMRRYFSDQTQWQYLFSWFTIKTKLKASHIDDSRPTEITRLHERPAFYCLFSGKINSIYEIEKIV